MSDQQTSTTLQVRPFEWLIREEYNEETEENDSVIHCWAFNNKSEPCLVRIPGFPAFCFLELPRTVNGKPHNWNETEARRFMRGLKENFQAKASYVSYDYKPAKKFYYYNYGKETPMVRVQFSSVEKMRSFSYLFKNLVLVRGFGNVKCFIHETGISMIRKLLTAQNLSFCQWFSIDSFQVTSKEAKLSTVAHEYIGEWTTMKEVPKEECAGWVTRPRILSWDIETYSHNPKAMPDKYHVKDVVYMISCIYYSENGERIKYNLLFGDCNEITSEQVINKTYETELEMLNGFGQLIMELDPTVLIGYNIYGFDFPYIEHRMKRLLEDWDKNMSRIPSHPPKMSELKWRSGAYGFQSINIIDMEGRIPIDMLPVIRRDFKFDKYTLSYVSQELLGKDKLDMPPQEMFRIFKLFNKSRKRLLKLYHLFETVSESKDGGASLSKTDKELLMQPEEIIEAYEELKQELKEAVYTNYKRKKEKFAESSSSSEGTDAEDVSLQKLKKEYETAKAEMTRVVEYCIRDSDLVLDLFLKTNTWISVNEFADVVGVTIKELLTRGQQIRCVSQLYDLGCKKGFVLNQASMPVYNYSGGLVQNPIVGLHDKVLCFDFNSLYPNIMITYNICYTTLIPKELENEIPDEDCHVIEYDQEEAADGTSTRPQDDEDVEGYSDAVEEDPEGDPEGDSEGAPKKKTVTVHYRFKFWKHEEGILPGLERKLIDSRNYIRKVEMKKTKDPLLLQVLDKGQLARKVAANSMYGFLAANMFPLLPGAMCVTAKGRELVTKLANFLVERYNSIVTYGDTDSIMPKFKDNPSAKEAHRRAKYIENHINKGLKKGDKDLWGNEILEDEPPLFPGTLKIEMEKIMKIVYKGRKMYFYYVYDENGEFVYKTKKNEKGETVKESKPKLEKKGIVLARRDNFKGLLKLYEYVARGLLEGMSFEESMLYTIETIEKVLKGDIDIKSLVYIRELGGNYKSESYFMNLFGKNLRKAGKIANPGDRLEYLIIEKDEKLLGNKMVTPEQYYESNGELKIDYAYYVEKGFKSINDLYKIGYPRELETTYNNFYIKKTPRARILTKMDKIVEFLIAIHKSDQPSFEPLKKKLRENLEKRKQGIDLEALAEAKIKQKAEKEK